MSAPSPTTSRFAAVSLLALLLLFLIFYVMFPLWNSYSDKYDQLQNKQMQLSRFQLLLEHEQDINQELKRINDLSTDGDLFLRGNKKSIASANLREFINEAVKSSGGQLVSSQEYEAEAVESATAVGLKLQVSGTVQHLIDLLHELEGARPIIFIDELLVNSSSSRIRSSRRARTNRPKNQAGTLDIRMDVVGYLPGAGK